MSFWDESSDILCKGRRKKVKKVKKPTGAHETTEVKMTPAEGIRVSRQKVGSTFTPTTGHDAGTQFKILPPRPWEGKKGGKKAWEAKQGMSEVERGRMGFHIKPDAKMGYRTPSSKKTVKRSRELASDLKSGSRPTSRQVKEQYEEASPSPLRELGNLGSSESWAKYPLGIPDTGAGQAKFRNAVKSDLADRQHRFRSKLAAGGWRGLIKPPSELSQKGKVMKQMLDRLPSGKRKEIMDTYNASRIVGMVYSDQPKLAGLYGRFQTPDAYKKFGGFYFNPTVLEVARHEQVHGKTARGITPSRGAGEPGRPDPKFTRHGFLRESRPSPSQ